MSMKLRVVKRGREGARSTESRLMSDEDGDIWMQLVNEAEVTIGYILLGEDGDGLVSEPDDIEGEWILEPFHGTIELTQ